MQEVNKKRGEDCFKDEWTQTRTIHCPDRKCKGMLLDNPYRHELKCSDCGDLFEEIVRFEKICKN